MSDYDPRYPSSLSYPASPEGSYPPPPYAGHHGPPPPHSQYPPPPGGYFPTSPEGHYPPPAGSCPYPTAPLHDPNDGVPVPGSRPLYPELPQTYYPPPPQSSSSSSSSSPSSSSSSSNHSRSNYTNAKKQPPKYAPSPPGLIYKLPSTNNQSYPTPPPPYTPNPVPPYACCHNNAACYFPNVTPCCGHIPPTSFCCHFNNPNNFRPNYNTCHHRHGPHNRQKYIPRVRPISYAAPPVQNRTEKVFVRTLKHEARYVMNEPARCSYESVPCEGAGYYWIDWTSDRGVPPTAVRGGTDVDGAEIYVGRAYHEGDWIPAKVIPGRHVAYVAYGGGEHTKHKFQILCEQRFDWVPSGGGHVPFGAVEGGRTADGEILYIGRVWHDGAHTVGKVHPSHRCLYIPFDCKEMSFPEYEILVLRT